MQPLRLAVVLLGLAAVTPLLTQAAAPAVPGYRDAESFAAACDRLAESPLVTKHTLGKTAGGREIIALSIGGESLDKKPAVLVVGSVQANSLVGGALAFGMAERLVERISGGDKKTGDAETGDVKIGDEKTGDGELRALTESATFYFIPRPSPDASERFFEAPYIDSPTNTRPADDDRDGRVDEDPPADVNGDGWITQMRVEDPAGEWLPHPDEPRLMVKADPARGEIGRYRLLTEDDADDDRDGRFAEDAVGGVDFNRNFTFEYPYFKSGSGPNQVSEPESRAVADFAFDHPNIFLVLSFGPQANLLKDWKAGGDAAGVTTTVAERDAPHFKWMADRYRDRFEPKRVPEPQPLDGSFAAWAYFHYGRWSLATPGWWPASTDEQQATAPGEGEQDKADSSDQEDPPAAGKQKPAAGKQDPAAGKNENDDRGKDDRRRL
ncbi:MAG: M14 family metallopeptidase, partial [Planctomycetota bacterium]